jgi:hypothetical protein
MILVSLLKVGEPVGVDERAQDSPHFVEGFALFHRPEKAELHDFAQMSVDLVFEACLIGSRAQESTHHLNDLVAGEYETSVAAVGVVLCKSFSQEDE